MTILIKNAVIILPGHELHRQVRDIFIKEGIITTIGQQLTYSVDRVIEQDGLCISPGWIDLFANFADPGFEYKETLQSGAAAAAAGGYTHVCIIPNTSPVIHAKTQVEYIKEKSSNYTTSIHPIGAVSKNAEGKELAEMYDMYRSGAVAFTDGVNSIQSSGLLTKALQYVKAFDGVVIQVPDDKSIGTYGLINEGIISTRLGLPGKPLIAEELMVLRDLELAEYSQSKIHFTGVTSARAVLLIEEARKRGIQASCSITPYHLYFSDADMQSYDTNLKVNPPLRTEEQKQALLQLVNEGKVQCFASHHFPQEWDSKVCEFEYAGYGMIGLETSFGVSGAVGITIDRWIEMTAIETRKVLGWQPATLAEGSIADLTLFFPEQTYVFTEEQIKSASKNTPFVGKPLKGKVAGIINNQNITIN